MGSVGTEFPLMPGLDRVWGYEPSVENMAELIRLFAYDQSIATEDLVELRYRASIREDVQERFAALFPAPRQRWVDALALDEERLRAISQPTLLLHGTDDQVIPVAVSRRLADLIPDSRLIEISNCGHWVQIEQTDVFLAEVTKFLEL
jgi:pimeloyl-ACP methyl ester carboxylesterase